MCCSILVFFFKQKTAYELRISDWSSDVCSSDLGLGKPADLYLEGSDQNRGWFQSSLLNGIPIDRAAPYRQCLTHGFTVDEHGRKMYKSLGNGSEPQAIKKTLCEDLLRLWTAYSAYCNKITVS